MHEARPFSDKLVALMLEALIIVLPGATSDVSAKTILPLGGTQFVELNLLAIVVMPLLGS
jgi:hypothetical protein